MLVIAQTISELTGLQNQALIKGPVHDFFVCARIMKVGVSELNCKVWSKVILKFLKAFLTSRFATGMSL